MLASDWLKTFGRLVHLFERDNHHDKETYHKMFFTGNGILVGCYTQAKSLSAPHNKAWSLPAMSYH